MTLDQLKIFVAVADREHLTRAAEALHLTPSAVSSAVQQLESRYGVRLFDRIGRRIALSGDGRAFLDEARSVLSVAASAERVLTGLSGELRGTLTIAASQTIASYWLPAIVMRFRAAHPAVALSIAAVNTAEATEAVVAGRADLGLVEGRVSRPEIAAEVVAEDRLELVAAPDHPLTRAAYITRRDLAEASWILREPGSGTRSVLEAALRDDLIDPEALKVMLELPSGEAICAAVRHGRCLAAVSQHIAHPHVEAGRLAALRHVFPTRPFLLLRHRERSRSRPALAFEAMVREQPA